MDMGMRLEQRPVRKATATVQMRQQQLDKVVEQQQQTALILERIAGRLDAVEKWMEDRDEERRRREDRRDERVEKQPDQLRANIALLLSGISGAVYVISLLASHWKP